MSEKTATAQSSTAKDESEKNREEKSQADITTYLQAPRKKRKNYVLAAFSPEFPRETAIAVEAYLRKSYPNIALSTPKTPKDLMRQFNRNISLLIIDDQFDEDNKVMEMVGALKSKRQSERIPVLFLTKNPRRLVELYHQSLFLYHEIDDYHFYPDINRSKLYSRIKNGIENQNLRRARRYKVNLPITFFHLIKDQTFPARILDLSLYGALIQGTKDFIFKEGDQIRLNIPIGEILGLDQGDFLKLSAKIRRVYISGNLVAVSFEYVSDAQQFNLTQLLTNLVTIEMKRQTLDLKRAMAVAAANK